MRLVKPTSQFKKSFKRILMSGRFDKEEIQNVIKIIARGEKLDNKFEDHQLHGKFLGHRECHIRPNLLLLYRIENNNLVLVLADIGSHPGLF